MTTAAREGVSRSLREISVEGRDDLDRIAEMHMELLDFGPMAGLGRRFIRDACYAMHMRDGLLHVTMCEVDGQPAGFVAFTDRSLSFHRQSLASHWLRTAWILLLCVLEDPRRLRALIRAVRVVFSRRGEKRLGQDPMGEVVCVAARPAYLTAKFTRQTGLRLSEELITHAARRLRDMGVREMRMLVDADNRAVLMLYHRLGARFEPYQQAGEPMVHVWFELDSVLERAAGGAPG